MSPVILVTISNVGSEVYPYRALSTYADAVGIFVGASRPIMHQLLHVRRVSRFF